MQIWCEGRRKVQELDVDLSLGRFGQFRMFESEDLRNAEESMSTRGFLIL